MQVASKTADLTEQHLVKNFFYTVRVIFDPNLEKVRFICANEFSCRSFVPYCTKFFAVVKQLFEKQDLGFSVEVVSSAELKVLFKNNLLADPYEILSIDIEAQEDECIYPNEDLLRAEVSSCEDAIHNHEIVLGESDLSSQDDLGSDDAACFDQFDNYACDGVSANPMSTAQAVAQDAPCSLDNVVSSSLSVDPINAIDGQFNDHQCVPNSDLSHTANLQASEPQDLVDDSQLLLEEPQALVPYEQLAEEVLLDEQFETLVVQGLVEEPEFVHYDVPVDISYVPQEHSDDGACDLAKEEIVEFNSFMEQQDDCFDELLAQHESNSFFGSFEQNDDCSLSSGTSSGEPCDLDGVNDLVPEANTSSPSSKVSFKALDEILPLMQGSDCLEEDDGCAFEEECYFPHYYSRPDFEYEGTSDWDEEPVYQKAAKSDECAQINSVDSLDETQGILAGLSFDEDDEFAFAPIEPSNEPCEDSIALSSEINDAHEALETFAPVTTQDDEVLASVAPSCALEEQEQALQVQATQAPATSVQNTDFAQAPASAQGQTFNHSFASMHVQAPSRACTPLPYDESDPLAVMLAQAMAPYYESAKAEQQSKAQNQSNDAVSANPWVNAQPVEQPQSMAATYVEPAPVAMQPQVTAPVPYAPQVESVALQGVELKLPVQPSFMQANVSSSHDIATNNGPIFVEGGIVCKAQLEHPELNFLPEIPLPGEMLEMQKLKEQENITDYVPQSTIDARFKGKLLNSIVIGENKQLYQAIMSFLREDSKCNTMYLSGAPGSGKSHTACALYNEITLSWPQCKVLCFNANSFVNKYTKLCYDLKNNRHSDLFNRFCEYFKDFDVLIIDEFERFHTAQGSKLTINTILNEYLALPNKRLIILSRDEPGQIKNQYEHGSRFVSCTETGVRFTLKVPSYQTKCEIVKLKSAELELNLSDYLTSWVAANAGSEVRNIESALFTIKSVMAANPQVSDQELLESLSSYDTQAHRPLDVTLIQEMVAKELNVTVADMCSSKKKQVISQARSIAMYCCSLELKISLHEIGRRFKKDHSSVHEALKRVTKALNNGGELKQLFERVNDVFNAAGYHLGQGKSPGQI